MKNRRIVNIARPFIGRMEMESIKKPLLNGWITQGRYVADFENKFAGVHNVKHAIATTSCTTALHLSLVALGIGPGDEVIVPSFTWIATANAVEYVGAKPVFCDIEHDTYNINVDNMKRLISKRTKAVIPVHLFGLCAPMYEIKSLCSKHGIHIIEDAACAIGASIGRDMAGSFGDIGCFSFHPRKVVTTGEGGMCTTNSAKIAKLLISLRNHGASIAEEKRSLGQRPYIMPDFKILGYNYRMTDLQGALGLAQLSRLPSFLLDRQKRASWYRSKLKDMKWLMMPESPKGFKHTYQSFVCRIDEKKAPMSRNEIMRKLHAKGIEARPGTIAVHMQDYYAKKYSINSNSLPISKYCSLYSIAIPLHNRMLLRDYEYVVNILRGI